MKKIIFVVSLLATQLFLAQKVAGVEVIKPNQKAQISEVTSEQKKLFDVRFHEFIKALKSNDKIKMQNLSSEKVKGLLSDVMITRLQAQIDTSKEFVGYKTRQETLLDQETYPVIEYKYADDKNETLKKTISVYFETDGLIMGIQPSK